MMCFKRLSNSPYQYEIVPAEIANIANHEKIIPNSWISSNKNDVTQELIDYIQPLIDGETQIYYEKGIPSYCDIHHLNDIDFFSSARPL